MRLPAAVVLPILLLACSRETPAPPPAPAAPARPEDPALKLDGVVITRGEIEEFMPYFRELDPTMGRNACIRVLLEQHLIPLAFARKEFAAERTAQRERAAALAGVLGQAGYADALDHTQRMPDAEVLEATIRQKLPLVEQRWLFDDQHVGQLSPVLEAPQGYSLVAASTKRNGLTKAYDQVDALVVRFYHHRSKTWSEWLDRLTRRLASLAKDSVFVHPDYRDALPAWLTRTQTP